MNQSRLKPALLLSALLAATSYIGSASAQTVLEEIVVTASKRAESVQDVSAAVTALDSAAIDRAGIIDLTGLEQVVPGLRIGKSGGEARPALRGARTNEVGVAGTGIAEQVVGIFLDGIYVPTTTAGLGAYVDVNRIEVLRGPQGTLYGRNTFAGSINVVTNAPNFDGINGSLKAGTGAYNRTNYEGVLNLPLSPNVATRLVIAGDQHEGMIENLVLPGSSDDLREKDQFYARKTTVFDLGGDSSITWRVDYFNKDSNSEAIWGYQQTYGYQVCRTPPAPDPAAPPSDPDSPPAPVPCNPEGGGAFIPDARVTPGHIYQPAGALNQDLGPYSVYRNAVSFDKQRAFSTSLVFEWATSFADVKLTGNYSSLSGQQFYDNDYSDGGIERVGGFGRVDEQTAISIEALLVSNSDGPLSWVAGFYGFDQDADWGWLWRTDTNGDGTADAVVVPGWGNPDDDPHTVLSLATFGQATFAVNDSLRLIGGLRYNTDDKDFTANDNATAIPNPPDKDLSWDDDAVLWKAAVEFDLNPDMMAYASASTGYRTGGQNDRRVVARGAEQFYDNEEVTSYEVGLKSTLLGGAMRLNAAAFINEYSDVKAQLFAVACNDSASTKTPSQCVADGESTTFEYYENGGDSQTVGVEVEMQWAVAENLTVNANLAWLDAEFDSNYAVGSSQIRPLLGLGNLEGRQDVNDPNSQFSFAGWTPALSPEYTAGLSVLYDMQLANGSILTPYVGLNYVGSYYAFDINIPEVEQDAHLNADLRLTWVNEDAGLTLEAFMLNALDEEVMTRAVVHSQIVDGLPANSVQVNWNNPRTWGFSLKHSF